VGGVRILTTNDFIGSFFPQPTSYGELPGAAGLENAVTDLRTESGGALWIDSGDFSQGSALGALSDGTWPFLAMRELSVDVAVAGNHELDWGREHLRRWARELPFPLLAANADLGLPPSELVSIDGREVGVIGLTVPDLPSLHPGIGVHAEPPALVAELAAGLRRDGATHVVLALHDGVDPLPSASGTAVSIDRVAALCAQVRGSVDLVVGGHTLHSHVGVLGGVPFLQPWPFGSQVGVADLLDDGHVELRLADVTEARSWTAPGAQIQAALEADVVGRLGRSLYQAPGRDVSLARAVADGLLQVDDRIDATYMPGDLWNQAARDGVHALLGAGEVTMAQVLRLTPFTGARSAWGGQLVAAELSVADAERVTHALAGADPARPGAAARRPRRGPAVAVALAPYAVAAANRALARDVEWQPIGSTWRDALLAAVSR
jgi:2',3'-cyclic-nucleotide 2'-phosphodiesterase (5'-nucleotidase family)